MHRTGRSRGDILGDMLPVSFVLPIYYKVELAEFDRAISSIRAQTSPADEVVVVCDGPVSSSIVDYLESVDGPWLTVVKLEENGGTAVAMQAGIDAARNRWIARQDADDVSLPNRLELQWELASTGKYAAIGGQMLEFDDDPTTIIRTRTLPHTAEAIARYVKINSPINNPTVLLDREAVNAVGGVHQVHLMEDYDLFARLISRGYKLIAVNEPVVLFQANDGMFKRRTGREMARAEWHMQSNLVDYGIVSRPRAVANFAIRQAFRLLPFPLIKRTYAMLFDRKSGSTVPTSKASKQ